MTRLITTHLPSRFQPRQRVNHQVIAFLRGDVSSQRLTTQSAATVRATLVRAAEEYADYHNLSLVSTRDCDCNGTLLSRPRFYVDGEELIVKPRLSRCSRTGNQK